MLLTDHQERDFEIVIGLVAAIGTDLDLVVSTLENSLRSYGYDSTAIRLSKLLGTGDAAASKATEQEIVGGGYYKKKMNLGDRLRNRLQSGDAVAALAVANIARIRRSNIGSSSQNRRHAWILRTLKHEDEVRLLRAVYGNRFILVGVHQDEDQRESVLKDQLAYAEPTMTNIPSQVAELMDRDQQDAANPLGQRVRETYALADYFMNMNQDVNHEVSRFTSLLFGHPFITPTMDEQAMFHAFAESLRSADPGRQVGAVITDQRGTILAMGCNDVPAPGGGLSWPDDAEDARDFRRGYDFNKQMTNQAMSEMLEVLAESGALSVELEETRGDARLSKLREMSAGKVEKTRVMSLIEFGRISHAEMTAITSASNKGIAIGDGTLYTTAFPCHMCMRLIVASGVRRVVYVDPYPKSLAFEMYREALTTRKTDTARVLVTPFWGASSNIFMQAFVAADRKRNTEGRFVFPRPTEQRMKLATNDPLLGAEETENQMIIALVNALHPKEKNDVRQ